jgi:hypothetical protein
MSDTNINRTQDDGTVKGDDVEGHRQSVEGDAELRVVKQGDELRGSVDADDVEGHRLAFVEGDEVRPQAGSELRPTADADDVEGHRLAVVEPGEELRMQVDDGDELSPMKTQDEGGQLRP